ncbi:MAG: peptidylprolyl isomerase [Pirellulales bacterium]
MTACWFPLLVVVASAVAASPFASEEADDGAGVAHEDRLLATVNGYAIHERHVRREISNSLSVPQLSPQATINKEWARATLELLVDRRVVLDGLRRDKIAASDAEIDVEFERFRSSLARDKQTLDDYRKAYGPSAEDVRDEMAWQISWRRYCEAELTDDAIAAYFDKHRRQFDGTRLRVSHILFALSKNADEKAVVEATERAVKLRARIVAGDVSFADAAMQFSDAPSKADGGDIGSITRRGEQHEAFAGAAFALAVGEISPPTRTPHGVHLIRCAAEQPGEKKLADVREAVVRAATTELFRRRADAERPKAKIVYADDAAAASE